MSLKTYNPKEVSVIVGARVITGFAEDSKVIVARENDSWAKVAGVDGEVTRSKSNDKSGSITINLMQSSDDNAFLTALYQSDELSGAGVVPVTVKDNSGTSLYIAPEAWIRKPPDSEFSREAGPREWILDCAELTMNVGGN